jgi:hypothetical protein
MAIPFMPMLCGMSPVRGSVTVVRNTVGRASVADDETRIEKWQ